MPWLLAGTRAEVEVSEPDVPQLTDETFAWNHRAPATVKVSRQPSTLRRLKVKGRTTAADGDAGAVQLPPPAEPEGERLQQDPAERPHQNLQLGAPDSAFGRGGAQISVAAVDPPEGKAKAKATAKAKAKAKGKAKAKKGKAKAKAQARAAEPQPTGSKPAAVTSLKRPASALSPGPAPKRRADAAQIPPDASLGCGKCRYSSVGCAVCRKKAGLILNAAGTHWVWSS